jgi:hypothetical protein
MKEKKTSEFIGAMIAGFIGLLIVNSVPSWRHLTNGIILESWVNILWAANFSMLVDIVTNFVLALYRPARMYSFLQLIQAVAGLLSVIVFFNVFPLDFSQVVGNWLNLLVKAVLIIAIFGSSIAIIVNLVRAVIGTPYKPS